MTKLTLTLALCFVTLFSFGQNYEFGKVSLEEVQMTEFPQDSLADAVYLHKGRKTYFDHDHPEGWLLVTEMHHRIKVLTKEGLDYGTIKQRLFRDGSSKERIVKIKGYTYNEENGKLVKEKLRKNGIFDTKMTDNWSETSITLPDVKEGSVVEITYTVISPFYKMDDLIIQEDIPLVNYTGKVSVPNMFKYKRMVKGNFAVNPKDYSEKKRMTISYEQNTNSALTQATKTANVLIDHYTNEYKFRNIEALRDEVYVDNVDNYRYTITYELSSIERSDGTKKHYSTTWEEVAKSIYKSKWFGEQIDKTRLFKDDIERIRASAQGDLEKMNAVFDFVKGRMTWDGRYGKYSIDGIRNAYKEKSGNSADINLLLVAMLREIGLNANPVLISTRQHGIPVFPTLDGFNYVIGCVEINGEYHLMDATEKLSAPNILPHRVLNWRGTLVKEGGISKQIALYPESLSQRNTLVNVTLFDDGSMEGTQRANYTALEGLGYRLQNHNIPLEKRIENIINSYELSDVTELEVKDFDEYNKPVSNSFTFEAEEAAEVIGNDIYFSPLFYLCLEKNPFTLEERNYPIDYIYPFQHRKIVSVKIPEGYKVSSMPDPVNMSLPDGMGSFVFNVSEAQGVISIRTTFKMNHSVIPAFKYPLLKEFYDQRVLKENEKIVLTKI